MTKAEIVSKIARETGIEKMAVLAVVEEFMGVVKGTMAEGENVYLRGFGSFVVRKRAEKTGRNISKNTRDIKCLRTNVKNVCARTDIRRNKV